MARMVGFTRIIRLPWLNKTIELAGEGLEPVQMREELEEYLKFEISSPTSRRKTCDVLLYPWVVDDSAIGSLRPKVLELAQSHPYEQLPLHWGMLIVAYPMFGDLVRLIGKLSEYQDEFTATQLKGKILDEWGERSTVVFAFDKELASLNTFGVIQRIGRGRYTLAPKVTMDEELSLFLLHADMLAHQSGYRTYNELQALPELFPFTLSLNKEQLVEDERFSIGYFGRELTVSLREG